MHDSLMPTPAATPHADDAARTAVPWPPASTESIHGAVWPAMALLLLGNVVATLPLLWSVTAERAFWNTGPLASVWWLPAVTLVGVTCLVAGLLRLAAIVQRGLRAARAAAGAAALDWFTIGAVVCDARRDAGLLLAGARQYRGLGDAERRWLLYARTIGAVAYAAALVWLPFAFVAGVMIAARGVLDSGASLLAFVLLPVALLVLCGLAARTLDSAMSGRLERAWRRQNAFGAPPAVDLITRHSVHDDVAAQRPSRPTGTGAARIAMTALIVIAVLLPVPMVSLAIVNTVGAVIPMVTADRFGGIVAQLASVRVIEPYALPADTSITPIEAGEALHVLMWGAPQPQLRPAERAPVRSHEPWPADRPVGMRDMRAYAPAALARIGALTPDELGFHARLASHPLQAEFSHVARAAHADVGGGRWNVELLLDSDTVRPPSVRFGPLREASYYHIAKAVHHTARGEYELAETTLREIISLGLLLIREGPDVLDVYIGSSIANTGAAALEQFYAATGRPADALALRLPGEGIDAYRDAASSVQDRSGQPTNLRIRATIAGNDAVPRGVRWENLTLIRASAGCLSPHAAVFGPGEEYSDWLAEVRASLVRYSAEDALFRMSPGLPLSGEMLRRRSVVEPILAVTLGRSAGARTCTTWIASVFGNL